MNKPKKQMNGIENLNLYKLIKFFIKINLNYLLKIIY